MKPLEIIPYVGIMIGIIIITCNVIKGLVINIVHEGKYRVINIILYFLLVVGLLVILDQLIILCLNSLME